MKIADSCRAYKVAGKDLRSRGKPASFPSVPKEHPALATISMSIAANLLGMGNAATPLGLKAMEELALP